MCQPTIGTSGSIEQPTVGELGFLKTSMLPAAKVDKVVDRKVSALESNCLYERQQQHRLLRVGNKKERERANQMELHSCVKLQKIRTKESELRGRAQRS